MDSYVTYLQITSAESGRTSLLQLPPSLTPRLSFFLLWMLFATNAGGRGTSAFILGEPAAPLPGGRPACRPSTGR